MNPSTAREALTDMARVNEALTKAAVTLSAVDQLAAGLGNEDAPRFSGLRSVVEQAIVSAERVHQKLREAARP